MQERCDAALEIKILNSQTIKITLTTKDMRKYNLTHEILKKNENITKNLILKLLENVKDYITIDTIKNKLFLESFKTKEKGCILYLSIASKEEEKTKKNEKPTSPTVTTFNNIKNVKNFCINIAEMYKNIKLKSELYESNKKFILIMQVQKENEKKILALLKEFGEINGKGEIKQSIIREHCNAIFKDDAIEKILKL